MYKIGFVLDDTLDSTDGVQQYVLNVGKWMASQGHEVHYLVGATKRTDLPNIHTLARNLKVGFNQNRMSIPLPASRRNIQRLMRREKFDIIHVQMPYSPLMAGKVISAASRKTAVVGTFHVAPYSRSIYEASRLLRWISARTLPRFDEVMSVSETARTYSRAIFGFDSVVVPNAIDLQPFFEATPLKPIRSDMNIVFLGRLVERKGCLQFLQAMDILHREDALPDDCRIIVCGKGHMEIQLKEFVSLHDLTDLVTFTGYVSEEDKPRYLASGDIIIYPSTGGESFGIVLLEGMAAGRGVVLAGNNPGYAEVMHERPSALFDPNDEESFTETVSKYLDDPKLRREAAAWQREYVRQYDIPQVGQRILEVYERALHKRRG